MRNDAPSALPTQLPHRSLPEVVRTRGGVVFDPRQDRWAYRDGVKTVSIDFHAAPALSTKLKTSLKRVLLWYAENSSPNHVQNMHSHFLRFARQLASAGERVIEQITDTDVLNYKASLTEANAWYLGSLAGLLKKWHQLGISGVSKSAADLLNELRLKGNPHGVAVLTMDTTVGPFTQVEQEAVQSALNDAYADGALEEDMYLLAWLFMAMGARPAQYAALKVCDLKRTTTNDGEVSFALKVPRVKQRNGGPRELFTERSLVRQIGEPLHEYAQRVRLSFVGTLESPDQAPLFPARRQGGRRAAPVGYEYHDTARGISERLSDGLNSLKVLSERTGQPLDITPVRFRRTLGTRAAQEGYGELVIAELLDHTDTQHVGVYVGSVPEIAERIDRAVAMKLAPLAQAFAGILIEDESQASRAGDPTSRIIDLRTDQYKPMGSCGQHSVCHFNAPIACYTCKNFEPWLDGPHEALLERLIAERDRLLATTDQRIAAVNDRTILAVAQVVQLCQEGNQKRASPHG
jgi:integrase